MTLECTTEPDKGQGIRFHIFYLQFLGIPMSLKNARLLSCFGGTQCRGPEDGALEVGGGMVSW